MGDLAVWYPGDGTGTMSAVEETEDGLLFVRLSINRPEVDDATRRELAADLVSTAIERIRFGPPPPVEVDLCELISDEDAERVLGPQREGRAAARDEVMGGGSPKVADISQAGETECQKLILTEIYVTAAMASESDFEPGTQIDGVDGQPISAVGDEAVWFEDVPGRRSFAAPHDTDIIAVRAGEAMFRITIALPDLDSAEQLSTARFLALAALTRLPGADGEVVPQTLETPDVSNLGFVDNLLAREADGEWTIGEGIVATLELFTGASDSGAVLRDDELVDESGTELIRMARAYVEDGPDDAIRQEIEDLLAVLDLPTLGPDDDPSEQAESALLIASARVGPDAGAGALSAVRQASMSHLLLAAVAQAQEDEEPQDPDESEEEEGYAPPPDLPDEGYAPPPDFPEDESYLPPHGDPWGVGECDDAGGNGWTAVPAYFGEDVGPFKAQIIYPESGFTPGWTETHLIWATEAVQDSLNIYSASSSPCLHIMLSVHGGSSSYVLDTTLTGVCGIFLNTPMQAREEAQFKQEIARDIAHCIVPVNWPDQFEIASFTNRRWWNGALAEFLSNVVYPAATCANGRCDLEWRLTGAMQAQEPTIPMMQRQDANWLFFQHLWWQGGLAGVIGLVDEIPASNEPIEHELAMAGIAGMGEVFHGFVEALSDSSVQDSGGGNIAYTPPAEKRQISGKQTIPREVEPFGTLRLHLTIDPGMFACIESSPSDSVIVTYRPGSPGGGGAGWEPFPTEEGVYLGEMVLVVTTTEPDGTFSLEVTDVRDEAECDDQEEASDQSGQPDQLDLPCLEICGPSDYYQYLEQVSEWFRQMIEAMMPDSHHSPGERVIERADPSRVALVVPGTLGLS